MALKDNLKMKHSAAGTKKIFKKLLNVSWLMKTYNFEFSGVHII